MIEIIWMLALPALAWKFRKPSGHRYFNGVPIALWLIGLIAVELVR